MIFKTLAVSASFLLSINLTSAQSIQSQIDNIFNKSYPANSPGAIVLIAKDDKVIYRKSFGMANLELNVPMTPENVLHLASITKQFTSVSILLLMEQGKLNVQDPLSKYIPDYSRGNEITLHNLLNHTSGIKSFTNLADFRTKTRNDMTPEEIISSFKKLPLEFEPGERYEYSNSEYVLLGYIIEKISGMSYEDFIQKYIFDKLGMKNSYYGNSDRIILNRASGYQLNDSGYQNAEYISMTIPYAAGSLMSTVDDMFLWSKAIHHNTLISEKSKQIAFTNYTLKNGKHNNYGYGWAINELAGTTSIEHTGGINGFTTSGIYVPDSNIYSIVLTNLDDGIGPEAGNLKAASIILGKPIADKAFVTLSEKQLKQWIGAYQFEDAIRFITYEKGILYSTREGGRPFKLIPVSENEFKFDNSFTIYKFTSKPFFDKKSGFFRCAPGMCANSRVEVPNRRSNFESQRIAIESLEGEVFLDRKGSISELREHMNLTGEWDQRSDKTKSLQAECRRNSFRKGFNGTYRFVRCCFFLASTDHLSTSFLWSCPQSLRAIMTAPSDLLCSVAVYSTLGGKVLCTILVTSLLISRSFSSLDNILSVMPVTSLAISLNRFDPVERLIRIGSFQLPLSTSRASLTGNNAPVHTC